jgi:serine/threonine protein phosphatase PrpC
LVDIVSSASDQIPAGYTTAAILFLTKKGDFAMCCVGDSPIYSISKDNQADSELPIGRVVGDQDSVFKFLQHRNYVTSVLGHSGKDIQIHTKIGKLNSSTAFIICSDGLSDNLFFESLDGAVSDSAGLNDLSILMAQISSKNNSPKNIVHYLESIVKDRVNKGRIEEDNRIMVPKQDDLSIIYINFTPTIRS